MSSEKDDVLGLGPPIGALFLTMEDAEEILCRYPKNCSHKDELHNHCRGCGYPIHASEEWCGECVCEEDGL